VTVGRITVSDRAHAGVYADQSGPEIEAALREVFGSQTRFEVMIIPDQREQIASQLKHMADVKGCDLIVTTGGTGVSSRDVTPEATRDVLEKELPGFGEVMRMKSMEIVKTAILSRATAGTRGASLIVNLPGKPKAVRECLDILAPAIVEGMSHLQGKDPHTNNDKTV